jgi:hypothetical protein
VPCEFPSCAPAVAECKTLYIMQNPLKRDILLQASPALLHRRSTTMYPVYRDWVDVCCGAWWVMTAPHPHTSRNLPVEVDVGYSLIDVSGIVSLLCLSAETASPDGCWLDLRYEFV